MALRKCNECGHQISTKADVCPSCGAPQKKKSLGCIAIGAYCFLGFIALGFVLNIVDAITGGSSSKPAPSKPPITSTSKNDKVVSISGDKVTTSKSIESPTTPKPISTPKVEKPEKPKLPPKPKTPWRYRHSDHDMSQGRIQRAYTQSLNTVNWGFPYNGAQRAELMLRTHPEYGKDIIVSIPKGQFLVRSYEDTKARVRFDEGKARTYSIVGAEDHSSNIAFFRDYHGFVGKMLKAKKVRISIPVYRQGSPVFEFDVSNFSTKEYLER